MGLKTYKATEWWMRGAQKVLGFKLRVSGAEHLPDRPTMYVSNHFTRIETFLTPFALFTQTGKPVRSLANHGIFKGPLGRYYEALGGMSLNHPRRNLTIIRELMTGVDDWLIYPEGGLIKNKKIVSGRRLQVERPTRTGPPHTGAALLALKAEISKQRYREACRAGDAERRAFYEERYQFDDPSELSDEGIVIVPINITFYPLRPGHNPINALARRCSRRLDPRLEEELMVEGHVLLGGAEVIIHFGEPIEVSDYFDRPTTYLRRIVGSLSEIRGSDLAMGRQARKLTDASMRKVYEGLEVNLDHLFGAALARLDRDTIDVTDLHRILFLTATTLADEGRVRVHPTFLNGVSRMLAEAPYPPLESVVALATESGILHRVGDVYHIDRAAFLGATDFHEIRVRNPLRVVANELEAVKPATTVLDRLANSSPAQLGQLASDQLRRRDAQRFRDEHAIWTDDSDQRSLDIGEPFFWPSSGGETGVVLVHGYLGCPEQMRPLGQVLHDQGMGVYGARLPGHGTSPSALPHVTWSNWMDGVYRGVAVMRQHHERVVIAGFSLGGMLALRAAAQMDEGVDAVVSINAPLHLRGRRLRWVPLMLRWRRLLRTLGLAKGFVSRPHLTESPGINYDHHYLEAVSELRRAIRATRQSLGRVQCPVLLVHSENDPLVAPDSARILLAGLRSPMSVLAEVPFDRHMIVRGPGSDLVHRKIIRFLEGIRTNREDDHASQRRSA